MQIVIKNILMVSGETKTVYIKDDKIDGIDKEPEGFKSDKTIDGKDKLLIPGLINMHTHAYMSLFRNVADDLSFEDWLFKNIEPREDRLLPEDAYWGAQLSMIEMIKSGTTCFVDMHMHQNQTARAVDENGMRAVLGRGLVGEGDDEGGARRIFEAEEEMEMYKNHERLGFMYAPHAPYSCDGDYLKKVTAIASQRNMRINIHLAESKFEIAQANEKYGCTPIEWVNKCGLLEVPVVAAHCVNLTDADIAILKNKNVNVAINPKSNMKLGNGFAPVKKLLDAGINVCLGTDGAASNNSLNMFGEMNAASLIYKGDLCDPVAVSSSQIFDAVTINAAKALGREGELGVIAPGVKADLCIIDLNTPSMRPKNNLLSSLSYSANGSEVDTVIVNGKILLEGKELKTIDEEKVYYMSEKICERING